MLTHLAIVLLGSGIFLRMVGKEKNRRQRHLLMRLEELKRKQAAATPAVGEAEVASGDSGSACELPVMVSQAA